MDSDGSYSVEALSWDLTMGVAANVLGKMFLRTTSSSSSTMPEAIDHVGIIVYNRLYEYGHNGIIKSSTPRNGEDPVPQYPGCKLRKREFLGSTVKPRHAFVEWLINVKYGRFKSSEYDMISHNCLHFAKDVCIFLGVPPSINWDKVSNWAKSNQKLADYLTRGFRVPRQLQEGGRSASLQENASNAVDNQVENISQLNQRRFSVRRLRSASMETLPPTYEEALRMTNRRESCAPKYEELIRE